MYAAQMKPFRAAGAAIAAVLGIFSMHAPAADEPLLIVGASVLNPEGERWVTGQAVLIVGEKIEQVAPEAQLTAPKTARRIDVAGQFLIPGLMDLHTHLCLRPYDQIKWDDQ